MLIVLSGTSSAGKTLLAQTIQEESTTPLFHLEADRFLPSLGTDEQAWADKDFATRVSVAMHEAIVAFAAGGLDVIVDGALPTERTLRDRCLSILRRVQPCWLILVQADADALRRRERDRPERLLGWAESQLAVVSDGLEPDLILDGTISPVLNARRVIELVGLM